MSWPLVIAVLIWGLAIAMTVLGTIITLRNLGSRPPESPKSGESFVPVSILKPLKGADAGIRENLESFFRLDYPRYELLFSVADPADPVCEIVRGLIWENPGVSARLLIGEVQAGPNPKVNNLLASYEQAEHDRVLISDSNVRVPPEYLRRLVAHLGEGVGMVTSIVAGRDAESLGGALEATYLNTFYARGMTLAFRAGFPCVLGKSMLFQRSTAKRFGGLRALARYLAEDYAAGEAVRQLGLKIALASDPVPQHIGRYDLRAFWSRHVRWGRIRKSQAPLAFLAEPWLGCIPSALIGAWAFSRGFGVDPSAFVLGHLSAWSVCDLLLMRKLGQRMQATLALTWFIRELLQLPLWIHVASGNTVLWRGRRLKIQAGGTLEGVSA